MKPPHKVGESGKAAPKNDETRTAPTVSGLKGNQKQKHGDHSCRSQKCKASDSRSEVIAKAKCQAIGIAVHVTSSEKVEALTAIRDAMPGNTASTQERRLLAALAKFSLSTYEASRYLDSYDPRARVMGLRNKGHDILTSWAMVHTECGRLHRVGIYTLHRGGAASSAGKRQSSLPLDFAFADEGVAT